MENKPKTFEIRRSEKNYYVWCGPQKYLCRDGKIHDWVALGLIDDILYFKNKKDAQHVIDKYLAEQSLPIYQKIVELKNMVKGLRAGFSPERIVELYQFVENL